MIARILIVISVLTFAGLFTQPSHALPPLPGPAAVHHPVSARSPEVQRLFDQGLFYIYAFNHDEAIRCFEEAAKLDPGFAMAYWGIALALGPNINMDADPPRQKRAYEAAQKALALSARLPGQEKDYIRAIAVRYTGRRDEELHKLANGYKDAMEGLHLKYPDDPDAATLYAESLMDLHPWQLWSSDGRPTEGTPELVLVLESVLRRYPSHVGANHYYIHAVEASPHPEWALPSAERLQAMQLPAGHLVHMPSHIYMRIGDYEAASRSNEAAAAVDEQYLKSSSGGMYALMYYSHNLHFLAVARGMEGRYQDALDAAEKLARHVAPHAAGMPMLELFVPTPILMLARFHKWPEILQLPEPAPQLPMTRTVWHFARGLAFAATGNLEKAREERKVFLLHVEKIPAEALMDVVKARDVIQIARLYLDAEIARAEGNPAQAIQLLRKGVAAEDLLPYTEPPGWYLPLREPLGGALLRQGDYLEAEKTFRAELVKNPRSGRALFGLWQSLRGQGRSYEAQLVEREYRAAWKNADTELEINAL